MNMNILLTADAQTAGGGIIMIAYIVLIVGFMYFFMIRPQKKEQKKQAAMLSQLEVGDCVLTSSGLVMERSITDRISAISNGLYQRTLDLMKDHKEETEILAKKLIEVKTLDGNEVLALLGKDRKDYESC